MSSGSVVNTCRKCDGVGQDYELDTPCDACDGWGEVTEPCDTCQGSGTVVEDSAPAGSTFSAHVARDVPCPDCGEEA